MKNSIGVFPRCFSVFVPKVHSLGQATGAGVKMSCRSGAHGPRRRVRLPTCTPAPSAYLLQPPGGAFPNGVMEIKPVFMLFVLFNYFILPSFVCL